MGSDAEGGDMERVCFTARVRPDRLDEYRKRHETVWPQMRAALAAAGWGNSSIFLAADGLLVGYLEAVDYQAALAAMAASQVNARWQAEMSAFFVTDGPPDQAVIPPGGRPPYPPGPAR
jgi:L-rhamnose mutarotase